MMKKGFTIIELIVVIGIIGILLGIVTTAAAGSIKQARARKAEACCILVQQGLATYYAQYAKWPGSIGDKIRSGIRPKSNSESSTSQNDANNYVLELAEVKDMIADMILEGKKNNNPMMDVSGLFVTRKSDVEPRKELCPKCNNGRTYRYFPAKGATGLDFITAVRGTKRSPRKMRVSEMSFGYPHKETGGFMPFKVVYSIPTDTMTVSQWHWE